MREARQPPLQSETQPIPTQLNDASAYDVHFQGFDDTPLRAWYMVPSESEKIKLPAVVLFHGYPIGVDFPENYAMWLQAGFAVLAVDIRGQLGRTGNHLVADQGQVKGFVTQNILNKERCYYRAIYVDGIRAIDWLAAQSEVDSSRIAVAGGSQGGGMALAMSALSDQVCAVLADIPNMCHVDYGIYHSTGSLSELATYCSHYPAHLEQVLETLSYFDLLNLADRIDVPAMLSVGFKDTVCPPETIFPVYKRIRSKEKVLKMYPFIGHEVLNTQVKQGMEFLIEHTSLRA